MNDECIWTQEEETPYSAGLWETECGKTFQFETDGPAGNEFNYCCYCGMKLREAK